MNGRRTNSGYLFITVVMIMCACLSAPGAAWAQSEPGQGATEEDEYRWEPVLCDNVLPLGRAATSWLKDKKDPGMYGADKAFDGNIVTAWVEGVDGDGIGEKLGFFIGTAVNRIRVLPGIGVEKYFRKNNRVKKAWFSVYEVKDKGVTEYAMVYQFEKLVKRIPMEFKDSMAMQEFAVGVTQERQGGYVCIIEIVEVYRGTAWRDTGIAEVEVK